MRIKLNAFPVVYFNAICTRHNCAVDLHVNGDESHVGQITSIRCTHGDEPLIADCTENWELIISGGGDITITR